MTSARRKRIKWQRWVRRVAARPNAIEYLDWLNNKIQRTIDRARGYRVVDFTESKDGHN